MYNCGNDGHNHYNENYDVELDALTAYNNYISIKKEKTFKQIFKDQLDRNL